MITSIPTQIINFTVGNKALSRRFITACSVQSLRLCSGSITQVLQLVPDEASVTYKKDFIRLHAISIAMNSFLTFYNYLCKPQLMHTCKKGVGMFKFDLCAAASRNGCFSQEAALTALMCYWIVWLS